MSGQEAVIAIREERTRIGNIDVTKQTLIAATDEGVIAIQVGAVEQRGYNPYNPRSALLPPPQHPAISYEPEPSCTDYCCCACDSQYEWYMLKGKGCCCLLLLLLFYLILGLILFPFVLLYFICRCMCHVCGCGEDGNN